jgi:hypothetical protein
MSELSRSHQDSSARTASLIAAPPAQVVTGIRQSIIAVRALPSLVMREVGRLFVDSLFAKPALMRSPQKKGADGNPTPLGDLQGNLSTVLNGRDPADSLSGTGQNSSSQYEAVNEQRAKELEQENERSDRRNESGGSSKGRATKENSRNASPDSKPNSPDNSWGMKYALERINEAINRITESDVEIEGPFGNVEVMENHHFTVVEVDDQEDGYRKFTMFAEDDELMLEPWQFRFNDSVMQIEVYVRDPKQLPLMMERTTEFEASLAESTGLKVVLSFYCPGRNK